MALASLPLTGALKCYNNIDDIAFNALAWRARIDTFFSSDYPLLTNFSENSPSFVREVDGQNFTCLVGQAYPRGFQLTSTCLYFPFPRGFPPEGLVLVNMLAGTCDTDFCNKSATPRTQPTARARTPHALLQPLRNPDQTAHTSDRTHSRPHAAWNAPTHPGPHPPCHQEATAAALDSLHWQRLQRLAVVVERAQAQPRPRHDHD